jgi:flagellar protein FlgJ
VIAPLSSTSGGVALSAQKDGLAKAAKAFEAVFMKQMISSMRSASLGDELFGSSAGDQFRDMSDARLAESMAEGKGFGIAELLMKQFAARADTAPADAASASASEAP